MSKLHITEDLFLEKTELNRMLRFITDDAYKATGLAQAASLGLVRDRLRDVNFNNFRVKSGTQSGTVAIDVNSYAINADYNIIHQKPFNNLVVPNDNNWYWVKIAYATTIKEAGTLSVDIEGNIVGTGTKFTEVFRNNEDFPLRISFPDSLTNNADYEVIEVIDDTHIVIAGDLRSESNLEYAVVGAFSPDKIPDYETKHIYKYDSCNLSFVQEVTANVAPAKQEGYEFYIARVRMNGTSVVIEDKRNEIFRTDALQAQIQSNLTNKLLGVEAVKWDATNSTKEANYVTLGWGFRSTNWTLDTTLNRITISGGSGGRFKNTSYFTDGDFNGWRIYNVYGSYATVVDSYKSGSQINLTLDVLDKDKYPLNSSVCIVQPGDEIQFLIRGLAVENRFHTFSTAFGAEQIKLLVAGSTFDYHISYRYKTKDTYSDWRDLQDDAVGYYTEESFNEDGTLRAEVSTHKFRTLTNSTVRLVAHASAYGNFTARVDRGDAMGVRTIELDNTNPVLNLAVSTNKEYQRFTFNQALAVDHYINLESINAKDGNVFILDFHFGDSALKGTYALKVVQGFVNTGNIGTEIFNFNDFYFNQAKLKNMMVLLRYNGTEWIKNVIVSQGENTFASDIETLKNDIVLKANKDQEAWKKVGEAGNLQSTDAAKFTNFNVWYRKDTLGRVTIRGQAIVTNDATITAIELVDLPKASGYAPVKQIDVNYITAFRDVNNVKEAGFLTLFSITGASEDYKLTASRSSGDMAQRTIFIDLTYWTI